jgi:hypothetical protein
MRIFNLHAQAIEITSIEDWHIYCPPKEKYVQWQDKRSAKEMARYWMSKSKLLQFHTFIQSVLPGISFDYGIPEYKTKFDNFRNPRQHDLFIFARNDSKRVLLFIEGKADEAYGNYLVKDELTKARQTVKKTPNSNKLNRIEKLIACFKDLPELLECRYQLLTWLIGSIEEAKREKTDTIFLISQEFHSEKTTPANIERNANDLNRFVNQISRGTIPEVNKNEISPPIVIEGIHCYIGKHVTNI